MSARPHVWAAAAAWAHVSQRFREGWRLLPARDRRRWSRTIIGGYGVLVVVSLLLLVATKWALARGLLAWEAGVLRDWIETLPVSFSTAVWIQVFGSDITLAILVSCTAGVAAAARRPLRALSILAAYVLIDPVIRLVWLLWGRARPTVIMDGAAAPGFASFPSGHVAKTLAVYGILAYLWGAASRSAAERTLAGALPIGIGGLVMIGRLRMGAHWPSDVLAGTLLGILWLLLLIIALRRGETGVGEESS
ncbi:MAG: phosphatase PAP2 family protein [Gemmatimonadetes bacterium]|nr:phosphatase PAP2 family protein [Gemmatimonadota bacterium]